MFNECLIKNDIFVLIMASIKILLYNSNPKSYGTFPIVLRVIQNRKPLYYQIGYSVKPSDWDAKAAVVKKSYPNAARLNHLILKRKTEVSEIMLKAEQEERSVSNKLLKKKIRNGNNSSFNSVADEHLSDLLKLKKFNQHSGEKPRVNHFKKFLENEDISFQSIDSALLKKFMIYLKSERHLKERSIMNCLIVIRTIFNKAISEGIVESKYYPFGPGKIQIKFSESKKVGLNESEIKQLEDINLDNIPIQFHARNIWLTSFYLAGIRISDIIKLKWCDINDGRLMYVMGKNSKVVSLKIPDKATAIIELYRKNENDSVYVFPYLKNEDDESEKNIHTRTRSANSVINKQLNKIAKVLKTNKKLTMHISRHTFGQIACDKIAPQLLQKLYRHSDLKTTIGYQSNFIHNDVDGALSNVLDF